MEPREVMRLFVVRSPEPSAAVNPDRLGRSIHMEELSGFLERLKDEDLLIKLRETSKGVTLSAKSFLLQLGEKNTDLPSMLKAAKEMTKHLRDAKESSIEPTSASSDDIGEDRVEDEIPSEKPRDHESPQTSVEHLRKELIQLRDRWILDHVMDSRLVRDLRAKAGKEIVAVTKKEDIDRVEDNKEPIDREIVERALKIGTAILLGVEQGAITDKRLTFLLKSPFTPSMRIARALMLRKTFEKHNDLLPKRQGKTTPLIKRRGQLRAIRRIAIDVLDKLNLEQEVKNPPAPTFFSRVFRPQKARLKKSLDSKLFVAELEKRLDEEEKKELKGLPIYLELDRSPSQIPVFFGLVEEEICGITEQTAIYHPERTGYVVSALMSAYSRPQVPVNPIGFIELMRVTEELVDYTAREIAHIENKSGGETRERLHTYTETNQNIVSTEEFEETEETRDLQTTQRNELTSTASRITEQELSVKAGLNVSASYGVGVGASVQLDASLEVGYRSAITTSQQTASTVAREVVSKSLSRIRQNQRRSQTATILRTTEERNRHEFKVTASRTDTYLWVEKINELKLKAYGKRLVLEFFIPEPGLPLALKYSDGGPLKEPEEFLISPAEINEDNYGELKQKYGATGISPPPPEYLIVGTGHAGKADQETSYRYYSHEKTVKIPANYVPYKVFLNAQVHGWANVYIAFAGREVYNNYLNHYTSSESIDDTYVITPTINNVAEVDQQSDGLSLSVLFSGPIGSLNMWGLSVNVAVLCRRGCRAYEQWQLDTHDRVYAAYRARVAEFEEKKLSNPMTGSVGGSATANRESEQEAIKKAAIYILKGEPVFHDLFPTGDDGLPLETFNIGGLERLREDLNFFEEAFEWRQSIFFLYGSFWGNEERGASRKRFHSNDPRHTAFLTAGAARVLLPVLPGREREVLEYLARQFGAAFTDLSTDASTPSAETIYSEIWAELPPPPDSSLEDTWRKSLTDSRQDLVIGQGTIAVTQMSNAVKLNAQAAAFDPLLDLGREIWIEGRQFFASKITDATGLTFELDKKYSGPTNATAQYVVGARTVGAPWRVSIPTSLVVLKEFKDQIALQ